MSSNNPHLEPPPSTLPPGSTVWAYLRDSGGPTQDRSVQQQREAILEFCAQHGLILTHPPFEDIHRSGGSTQGRNDFDYMMSLSNSADQRPKGLLIWNYARFSRGGAWDAQFYKSTLRNRNIIIHSLTDKIPEGDFGPVIETIIDIANKQKKDEASMGAWRGLRHNVKQGAVPGNAPLGFVRKPISITSLEGVARTAHRWEPDPDFKHRINKAFQLKAQGKSLSQIHAETKLYGSINSYVTFFNNPIYIGILHFGDLIIEDYCRPTIPRKLWDKVQTIMQASAERKHLNSATVHPRRVASIYLLSSIAKCARCGGSLNGQTTKQPYGEDYRQYICATAKNKKTCSAKAMPAKFLENLILTGLNQFFDDPQNLINVLSEFQAMQANQQNYVDEERASISPQLAAVRKKLSRLVETLTEKPSSPALLKKLTDLEEQETSLLSQLAQLKDHTAAPIIVPTIEQSRERSQRIQQDLKSKDPAIARQTLLGIIDQIKADRIGKHLIVKLDFYHVPKKKGEVYYAYNSSPRGGTIFRHSISFQGIIPNNGRPRKKPLN
jgi:DNA invertase Pin-like site-specific DNA recombinase